MRIVCALTHTHTDQFRNTISSAVYNEPIKSV